MLNLQNLRVFTEIVQENSFAAAAAKLGLSPATASGRLKALEDSYGLSLINRTTRSLSLTEDGRMLFEQAVPLLAGFDALDKQLSERKSGVSGPISVSTPTEFGRNHVLPLINEFSEIYPEIDFKIIFEDGPKLRSTEDCAVMIRFGPLPDCGLTTRKLGRNPILTCASPKYLAARGTPQSIDDLRHHNCLSLKNDSSISGDWKFCVGGETVNFAVSGSRAVTDVGALLDLAATGVGIVQVTYWDACDHLEAGCLTRILDHARPPEQLVSLISESRCKLPQRTKAFIDFLVQNLRSYTDAVLGDPETKLRLVSG